MKISTQEATVISQVETRIDRLTVLHGTVLRCIGALNGNTDSASRLVCEALRQAADELTEMIAHDTQLHVSKPSRYRYRDRVQQPIDLESE
ncbi:MAG TPA: hypothetical protein P5149_10830 [Candidatus Competibacteraceae bacterium]|mgnify:FL=1|nr:hypothetical protein [Candidatus Competibacteraceae bacterium]MCP5135069.1 hypothetical protein [Gammaproteobacteria bacterium]HPF59164.1 hypothetical protein [Candidatus Competibacteraceae bacterium]HRY18883.1 hypothetical protein [Candidatus Competibacteraceae bacterium]